MDNELSVLVEGVLREAERVGLAGRSIKYYRRCCTAVVLFCRRRGFERLTPQALEEFLGGDGPACAPRGDRPRVPVDAGEDGKDDAGVRPDRDRGLAPSPARFD
jgi:hypothetical protein